MSIDASNWAYQTHHETAQRAGRKFVLVALADYADSRGACYPSLRLLVDKTDMSRNTVIARLDELVATGFVYKTGRVRNDGAHTANEYVLLMSDAARAYAAEKGWVEAPKTIRPPVPPPRQLEIFPQDVENATPRSNCLDGGRPTAWTGPVQLLGPHEPSREPSREPSPKAPKVEPPDRRQEERVSSKGSEEEPEQDSWPVFLESWRGTEPINRLDAIEPARHRFAKLMSRQERGWAVRFAKPFRDELRAKGRKHPPTMSVALRDKFWQAYLEDEVRRQAEGKPGGEITFIRPNSPEAQAWAHHEGVPNLFLTWSKTHRCEGAYKPSRWPPGHPNGLDPKSVTAKNARTGPPEVGQPPAGEVADAGLAESHPSGD